MRNPETTKHDYGHAILIAGGYGKMGCAILSAKAALRSGCGLVTVHLPSLCVDAMQTAFPEAMVSVDDDERCFSTMPTSLRRYNAIAIGPGIGTDAKTQAALLSLLDNRPSDMPLILDADALNILAMHLEFMESKPFANSIPPILTPHDGEYRRLFGEEDPQRMANEHNVIIVRKSHRTHVYYPSGELYVNHTGNAGMATAGSGDVLTGILLGMAAQVKNPTCEMMIKLAVKGVEIHGKIGDMAIQKQSESSLIASDMIEQLKEISIDISEL